MQTRSDPFPPTHHILFKPIDGCGGGGCHLDLWIPGVAGDGTVKAEVEEGKAFPLAIMIHGGGFTLGSAQGIPYNQVNYLLDHGVAVCSLEYRKAPHVRMKEIREDLLDAYLFIQSSLNPLLPPTHQLSLDRISCMGWSAGGTGTIYLTSDILAYNAANPGKEVEEIKAVVCTYTNADNNIKFNKPAEEFEKLEKEDPKLWGEVMSVFEEGVVCNAEVADWGNTAGHEFENRVKWLFTQMRYGSFNAYLLSHPPPFPATLSPIGLITPSFPPAAIIVATADTLLDPIHSYMLAEEFRKAGREVVVYEAQGMPHGIAEHHEREWPRDVGWWGEALRPGLDFAIGKIRE